MMKRSIIGLLGSALILASPPAFAQTARPPAPQTATDVAPVTVRGRRLPGMTSPKASCEAAMADPYTRALVVAGGRTFAGRSRAPRNPDYNAPPLVPPDAPLPDAKSLQDQGLVASSAGTADLDTAADATDPDAYSYAAAVTACIRGASGRSALAASHPSAGKAASNAFWGRMLSGDGPFEASANRWNDNPAAAIDAFGRGQIKEKDTTLPMAFALFDQGRYDLALEEFKAAYEKLPDRDGGDEAALMIGKIYLQGLRENSDPAEAVIWLKRAASAYFDPSRQTIRFNPWQPENTTAIGEAAVILANLYRNGHDAVPKDPAQSRNYLERAVEVGYVPAAKVLGDIYHQGVDTPRDPKKAFDYYMQAARYAHAPAAMMVAQMYSDGEAPDGPDVAKALAWRNEAAKLSDPEGLYAVAVAYDRGEGVAPDPERALALYKIAAVNGDAAAQAAIGTYFYTGETLPHDPAIARQWFEVSAMGGDADGMFNLAAMMAKGEGGEVDRVRAWGWLRIAEVQKHPNAAAAIAAIEAQFTPEDHAGVAELAPPEADLTLAESSGEPETALVEDLIADGEGRGPAWWTVSKGDRVVWIMGLPPGATALNERWDAAVLRARLKGAGVLIAPGSPWRYPTKAAREKGPPLEGDLAERLSAALRRVGEPLRDREATLADAVALHGAYYSLSRLTDHAPSEIYLSARSRRVRVVSPPRRTGPQPHELDPADPAVGACVTAILRDVATPQKTLQAAARAWANGDVAAALAAVPPRLETPCDLLWPGHWERTVGFQTEAIAMALEMPGRAVAVAHIDQLAAEDGILERLRKRGYVITRPDAVSPNQARP